MSRKDRRTIEASIIREFKREYGVNLRDARYGQTRAIMTTEGRILDGKKTTAIVLPTRYGKSDVMRVIAIALKSRGKIAATLILNPNIMLREQFKKRDKWAAAMKRYEITGNHNVVSHDTKPTLFENDETITSLCVQLVDRHLDMICAQIEKECKRTGLPVLVIIDECHTASEKNSWGAIVKRLTAAGAHVALFTATPDRADGDLIEGFEWEEVGPPTTVTVTKIDRREDETVLQKYTGTQRMWRLRADWETTFADAWDESPASLCKIGHHSIDIDLNKISDKFESKRLKDLTKDEATKVLGKYVVRSSAMIGEAAKVARKELDRFRRLNKRIKLIVFCQPDEFGCEPNDHGFAIQRLFSLVGIKLQLVNSTATDKESSRIINGFGEQDEYDGLILKQMGGAGLDEALFKVCVDLSATRTNAATKQRWTRVATILDNILQCVVITPADIMATELFRDIVKENGGEAEVDDLVLEDEFPIDEPGGGDDVSSPIYTVGEARLDSYQSTDPGIFRSLGP